MTKQQQRLRYERDYSDLFYEEDYLEEENTEYEIYTYKLLEDITYDLLMEND